MKRVLIAGATGYLGRYTVKAFKRAGYRVRVLVRSEKKLSQMGTALSPMIADDVDEVHIGDITRPETLVGICEDVDIVFSSISLMGQSSSLTWHDVDYMGNVNILNEAIQANVQKFIFISVFNANSLMHVPIVKAHEDFAQVLANSAIPYTVIRPTGYFSDLGTFLEMAKSGRVYLLGDGTQQINPIHGADLAQVVLVSVSDHKTDINIGGAKTYKWDDIAKIAFEVARISPRITHIPIGLARLGVRVLKPLKKQTAQLMDFFVSSSALESIAPQTGSQDLKKHYEALMSS